MVFIKSHTHSTTVHTPTEVKLARGARGPALVGEKFTPHDPRGPLRVARRRLNGDSPQRGVYSCTSGGRHVKARARRFVGEQKAACAEVIARAPRALAVPGLSNAMHVQSAAAAQLHDLHAMERPPRRTSAHSATSRLYRGGCLKEGKRS